MLWQEEYLKIKHENLRKEVGKVISFLNIVDSFMSISLKVMHGEKYLHYSKI